MKTRRSLPRPLHQQGAALVIALILLAVMTLLGLASLRGTLMDERMSAGLFDRGLAFQSAEAGLREAEERVRPGGLTFPPSGCNTSGANAGLCAQIDRTSNPTAPERWDDPTAYWHPTTFDPYSLAAPLEVQPGYFIELMGPAANWPGCDQEVPMHPNCMTPRYRITSRSAADGRSQVILQTNYAASAP